MPGGKGPLRIAIDDWLETNALSAWISCWKLIRDRDQGQDLITTARNH
jgi:hypothetical protein